MQEKTFADLGVSKAVCRALDDRGFKAPFAIQKKVIGDVLDGRDVLAKSPTGSGKTLAFGVPVIDSIEASARRPAALILAPTRELATQIVDETRAIAHARSLKVSAVYGGVSLTRQAKEAANSHIIVATPGRLEDQLERGAFTLDHVEVLVLDEADRMLDMGFKPAVDRIVELCPEDRQTLFFSATLDGEAGRIAKRYTHDAARHEHVPPVEAKADIEHRFMPVERSDRNDLLVRELQEDEWDLVLVFVRTKRGADRLVKQLKARGVTAAAMHGDKSQNQRERALADFERGKITTLVATDVAARGIHVDNIAKVVNYDIPGQTEDYVHRVGRTGRAGERGVAVTFVGAENVRDMGTIARELNLIREFGEVVPGFAPAGGGGRNGAGGQRPAGRPGADGNRQGGRGNGGGGSRSGRPNANGNGYGSGNGNGRHSNGSKGHRKGQDSGPGSGKPRNGARAEGAPEGQRNRGERAGWQGGEVTRSARPNDGSRGGRPGEGNRNGRPSEAGRNGRSGDGNRSFGNGGEGSRGTRKAGDPGRGQRSGGEGNRSYGNGGDANRPGGKSTRRGRRKPAGAGAPGRGRD